MLPNILPAIFSGVALAFARAVGEFGAVVLISGNLPFKTEVASVYVFGRIESGDPGGAAAASVVILAITFAILLGIGGLRRWAMRHDRVSAPCASLSLGYLAVLLVAPVGYVFYKTFEHGFGAGVERRHDSGRAARVLG